MWFKLLCCASKTLVKVCSIVFSGGSLGGIMFCIKFGQFVTKLLKIKLYVDI